MGCAVCVDTATGDTLTWGCEKVWVTGFSRESTRTCQSGRARWVTLLPDSLAGILSAKAGAFPSPNTPALNEATTSPSPGLGPASLIGQCQAGAAPPPTLFSTSQRGRHRREAQGEGYILSPGSRVLHLRVRGRTHQLEDVFVPGHDGELQSIIATETGQGVRPG